MDFGDSPSGIQILFNKNKLHRNQRYLQPKKKKNSGVTPCRTKFHTSPMFSRNVENFQECKFSKIGPDRVTP